LLSLETVLDLVLVQSLRSSTGRKEEREQIMKTAYFTGFFARTFKYLQETGLPIAEVLLLEEMKEELTPETFARAMAHAYERALAIQKGMKVLEEKLDKGASHLRTDSTCVWVIPRSHEEGHECAYATYGSTHEEAKMAYVLTHMALPIPMDDWLREYS
jgi:hypothetical protein